MTINEKDIRSQREKLAKTAATVAREKLENARAKIIDNLARNKTLAAVKTAHTHKILGEIPSKYLRQVAKSILSADDSDSGEYWLAADIYGLLGDKAKRWRANKLADERSDLERAWESRDDIYYR